MFGLLDMETSMGEKDYGTRIQALLWGDDRTCRMQRDREDARFAEILVDLKERFWRNA